MQTFLTISQIRSLVCGLKENKKTIGFVPTMGCLHAGHLSLIKRSKQENDYTLVSIYVNPTQFSVNEDFARYPRNFKADKKILEKAEVDYLFLPNDEELYGKNADLHCRRGGLKANKLSISEDRFLLKPPPYLLDCLCGRSRVGHFEGVAAVVSKFFNIIQPTRTYFGQKDYQQALIIKKLILDLQFSIEFVMCSTIREPDGLAMSSRNIYLTEEERLKAPILQEALTSVIKNIGNFSKKKIDVQSVLLIGLNLLKKQSEIEVEYLEMLNAETLESVTADHFPEKILLAGAIRLGKTRLIDNIIINMVTPPVLRRGLGGGKRRGV